MVIFLAILFVNAKIIKDGAERIVNYTKEYVPEAPFQFNVVNESLEAVQNEDFDLKVELTGSEIPNEVYLDLGGNSIKLRKKSNTEFGYTFSNIQEKKSFKLMAAGFSSQEFTINPIIKPVVMGYQLEVNVFEVQKYVHQPQKHSKNRRTQLQLPLLQ